MESVILINYTGRHGAGNIHALVMARELKELGEKVIAIVSKQSDNIDDWHALKLYDLIEIDTYSNKRQFLYRTLIFSLFERYYIKRKLDRYNIEAIYCPMCTYWTYLINNLYKTTKKLICKHDPIPHDGKKESILCEMAYKNADCIIVHSKKFVEDVKKQYINKSVVYMPLTSINIYGSKKTIVEEFYKKYKMNFIFFGVINDYKGLDVLGKAFRMLDDQNISLTIAANGNFEKYAGLYKKLKNCRVINRWIEDAEIPELFSCDNLVAVLPYKDATQSGVVLVAKEYDCPIIATKTGGLEEQIQDKINGLLIEPDNVEQLVYAMKTLTYNDKLYCEIKNNIHNNKEINLDQELAKKLVDLIRQ